MPKTKISEYDATAANNTDVNSINIAEGCAPSGINNAIRQVMADLKDFQQGTKGDPFLGPVTPSTLTLTGLTANRILYTNGSKVVSTSDNVQFDGTTATINTLTTTTLSTSGVATFSAGSVSAPAITTTGDTNTGIFFPEADTIAFTEGGVESMRINSSGRVGIGETNPTAPLVVAGLGVNTGSIHIKHTGNHSFGVGLFVQSTAGTDDPSVCIQNFNGGSPVGYGVSCTDNGSLAFLSGTNPGIGFGTERMRITAGGDVGIGTNNPTTKLQVVGKTSLGNQNITSADAGIDFIDTATTGGNSIRWIDSSGYVANLTQHSTGHATLANVMTINNSGGYRWSIGGSERMRISNTGAVGIAVNANLTAFLNFPTSDYGEVINYYSNASEAARSGVGKYVGETRHYVGGSDFFSWRTSGPSGTERMRLNAAGELLIGRTSTGFNKTAYGWQLSRDGESFGTVNTATALLSLNRNNDGDILKFFRDGTQRGWISVETTGTTYGNLSDRRAKENFTPAPPALTKLENVEIVSFDWKEGGYTEYGTVAQDLANELPFAVTVGDDGEEVVKPWGVDYSKIVPVLIKAIQELKATVDAQAVEIAALKSK